jgi:hypothetical protein
MQSDPVMPYMAYYPINMLFTTLKSLHLQVVQKLDP